jgi:hypothetical protein
MRSELRASLAAWSIGSGLRRYGVTPVRPVELEIAVTRRTTMRATALWSKVRLVLESRSQYGALTGRRSHRNQRKSGRQFRLKGQLTCGGIGRLVLVTALPGAAAPGSSGEPALLVLAILVLFSARHKLQSMRSQQVADYGSYDSRLEVNRNKRIQATHRRIQRSDAKLGGIDFQDAIVAGISQEKGALVCGCKSRVIKIGNRLLCLIEQIQEAH